MATHLITLLEEVATAGTTKPQRVSRPPFAAAVEAGSGSHLFDSGSQVVMEVDRAGTTGALTVYGMDAPDTNGAPTLLNAGVPGAQQFKGDGATVAFQSIIPFVALANNNWIVTSSRFLTSSTATVTAGSKTVTGAGSAFLTEYYPGQSILINGETRQVDSITSNTVLTTVTAYATSAAGVAIASVGSPLPAAGITSITNVGGFALLTLAVAPITNVLLNLYFGTPVQIYTGTDRLKKIQTRTYDFMWTLLGATPSACSLHIKPVSGK
jgi:hypothetical protein